MKGLSGVPSASSLHLVKETTKPWFRGASQFTMSGALIVYEQNMLDDDKFLEICPTGYDTQLQTPTPQYIPKELVSEFRGYNCVPVRYDTRPETVYVGVLPEKRGYIPEVKNLFLVEVEVPIYYYVKLYVRHYGQPDFLHELPAVDKLDMIVEEAIALQAADITITNVAEGAVVYYNVRKKKVHSKRTIFCGDVGDFTKLSSVRASAPIIEKDAQPHYLSVQLDMHHRGRAVVNSTYYGRSITIHVLSDDVLTETLERLNIAPDARKSIWEKILSREKGFRLFIDETMSGKNTTILSALRELVVLDCYKTVSVESPVGTLVRGIKQINTETEEERSANVASLLRQNPDVVYIIEITNYTAQATIQTVNTGRIVSSTIHANSISDVLSRLMNITNMSGDRLLLSMHSYCYQELAHDEETDTIRPVNRCAYFSDELKIRLYGKPVGECKMMLQEAELQWVQSTMAFSRDQSLTLSVPLPMWRRSLVSPKCS